MLWRSALILAAVFGAFLVYAEWSRGALSTYEPGAAKRICSVSHVYDGDTVEITCDGKPETARLVGFDAPETVKPGCAAEAVLGFEAKDRLASLIDQALVVEFTRRGKDKYDRALVRLEIDGEDVAKILVHEGLAEKYNGGKRINWCAQLGG